MLLRKSFSNQSGGGGSVGLNREGKVIRTQKDSENRPSEMDGRFVFRTRKRIGQNYPKSFQDLKEKEKKTKPNRCEKTEFFDPLLVHGLRL